MNKSGWKDTSPPQESKHKPPIAILGYCMELPGILDMTGDDLVEIIRSKRVHINDHLDTNAIAPHQYSQDGNPWLYQHRKGNKYDRRDIDFTLLQITEKESKFMSEQQMLALHFVWRGLEASGIPISLLHKTSTGVFVAASQRLGDLTSYPDETSLRGGLMSSISDRVAYFLGTHGPTLTVETACSSSLVALSLAVDSIRNGSCDVAIVASINGSTVEYEMSLQATGVISQKGECRPFDDDASGTLRCEGFGCVIVSSMDWAKSNGYCGTIKSLIVNTTVGSAGAHPSAAQGSGRVYESPNVVGMVKMIQLCHEQVGLPHEKVQYVEAHATGTRVGDLIELEALGKVYKDSHDILHNPLRVGSIKGNIGHAELSAGMFSLIKVCEMIRKRTFFPTGGHNITPRTDFDWEGNNIKLCCESESFPTDEQIFFGVNSFGVGGSYSHAVITEYQCKNEDDLRVQSTVVNAHPQTLVHPLLLNISAASTRHLEKYEETLLEYLQSNPGEVSLLDLCGLFAVNRSRLSSSRSYLVDSIDGLMVQLASDSNKRSVAKGSQKNLTIAMVFTGQGSQWVSMGRGLMMFKAYKDIVTRFDALYRKLSGWSPLDKLLSLNDNELDETMYAQPLTFMVQIGLIELLQYFGVYANIAIGHSAGEIAAQYCCGLLSLEESATVVFHRSRCQQALAGCGRMLAVQMDCVSAKAMLRDPSLGASSCSIACINSPSSVVLAGPQLDLERVRQFLSAKHVKNKFLKGNTAFHCSMMDPILSEIDAKLEFLNRKATGSVQLLSTVTAEPQTTLRSEYIVHNIRQPVRFCETVDYLLNHHDPEVIIEIGPHKTLAPLLVECIQMTDRQTQVLTSLAKDTDDVYSFWELIMGLIDSGLCIDLGTFFMDSGYKFSSVADKRIPPHPVIGQKFSQWILSRGDLSGKRDIGPASGTLASEYQNLMSVVEISRATSSQMTDHVMGGIAMLPGMYFVEAAIETWGFGHDDCLSMSDVTFHDMCLIPDRSKTEDTRKLFVRHSAKKSNGLTEFTVESRTLQNSSMTVHCTGSMASFPRHDIFDGSQYIPGIKGLRQRRSAIRDIGQDGLRALVESHDIMSSSGEIYSKINDDGVTEYNGSFRVLDQVRVSADKSSIVASLEFDHEQWMSRGGIYGVQLLDGILQICFLNPYIPSGHVGYAGGFDLGIFIRKPVENPCFVHFQFVEDNESFGQIVVHGDASLYDSDGLLLCHLIGIKSIIGKHVSGIFDAVPVWQPMSLSAASDSRASCLEGERRKAYDHPSIIATVFKLMHEKHALLQGDACHLRVLEFWEDASSVPIVLDALTRVDEADLPSSFNFVIEFFVVSYDITLLKKGYHVPRKHRRWLRLRLVSLPSAQKSFDQYNFDVIAAWKQDSTKGRWDDPMDFLHRYGRLGYDGSILLHDFDLGQMWEGYVEEFHDHASDFFACRLLKRGLLYAQVDAQSIYMISKDSCISSQVQESFEQVSSQNGIQIKVNARSIDKGDQQSIGELAAEVSGDLGEKHVVILDGISDVSEYAQDTFTLVARIAHQLGETGTECFVWLITSNALTAPINVHRASLLPLVMGLRTTMLNINAKFVDLAGPYDALPSLILSKPGPHQFLIDSIGIVHQRIMLPAEIASPTHPLIVHADDAAMFYKCELVKQNQATKAGNYSFFAHHVKPPSAGEVLVDIQYASLNFRDVMLTLNALPRSSFESSYYGYNLGMEGSGRVVAVGDGVHHVDVGDEVLVSGKGTVGSKLLVPASSAFKLDTTKLTMKDAACVSSVYSTAYHALIDLSRLKKGDRVLIHAAAGGVGHAAISICSHVGAQVYVTSSQLKRDYCADVLGVPKGRIFSSRDVSWFDDLMRATDDEGVDIVLNSLAGEHQRLGIQCLRPGGRFCEIGKADIFNNEKLSLFGFRKNIHMFAIDMDRMIMEDPKKVTEITQRVLKSIYRGDFKVLPSTCFQMDRLKDAIDFMKSGAHIGKVGLSNYSDDIPLGIECIASIRFSSDSYHLVLGGAGGFGSKIIRWLYKKGARKFITTVSKDPSRVTKIFEDLIASGAVFKVVEVDLSSLKDLETLERTVTSPPVLGHVDTMIHSAGIYEEFHIEHISDDILKTQCDIKVRSALFLDQLSRKLESVKCFILIGSNSAEITVPYFASYGASNAILASIGRKRLSEGLPAAILQMASLKDVGIVANDQGKLNYQIKAGYEMMNSARALISFDTMLSNGAAEIVHQALFPYRDIKSFGAGWIGSHTTPVDDSLLIFGECEAATIDARASYNVVLERVLWIFTDSLGIERGLASASTSVSSLGIDSLSILELRQQIQDEFGYSLDRSAFAMTIEGLSKEIYKSIKEFEKQNGEISHKLLEKTGGEAAAAVDEVLSTQDETRHIQRSYVVTNPKGYAIILPGADQNSFFFADWKLDDIQILYADLHGAHFHPKTTAKILAKELYTDGYLKDPDRKLVFIGYSFGSFTALEICKELLDVYDFCPAGFVPMCYAAPQACLNRFSILPKVLRTVLTKNLFDRRMKREYGDPDPGDDLYQQIPSNAMMCQWDEEGQQYFAEVVRDLKSCSGHYVGNIPIHYIYATKDQIGNPNLIFDPKKHGWGELVSGTVEIYPWYGGHSCLVDPMSRSAFQRHILDIIESIIV